MVIVMHQSASTDAAFMYNEKKVEQKKAHFFHSANTKALNVFSYSKAYRRNCLKAIEECNQRVKHKCFHVSVNPSARYAEAVS